MILVGVFGLGSSLVNYRLGFFAWELSFGTLRWGIVVCLLPLGSFILGEFVAEMLIGYVRLGTVALNLSLGNCCLGAFA